MKVSTSVKQTYTNNINDELHVLVIEDNPIDVRVLEYTLTGDFGDQSYKIHSEGELYLALHYLEDTTIDVVMLDLNLPDSRGLETLSNFKTVYPSIPVIVLTGMSDDEIGKEAIRLGAQDYLVKGEINNTMLRKIIDFSIERQNISKLLYEQDYKYRYLFDNSLDAIFITTRGGMYFSNFNTSLQRLLGYERADLFELTPKGMFKSEDTFKHCKDLFLRNGFINQLEVQLVDKYGASLYCLLNLNDIRDISQKIIGLQGIITDITSIKQQKEKLILLNQELELKVEKRTRELSEAKRKIDEKHKLVASSISYAENIQRALLPSMGEVKALIDNSFLIFKPRDVVSGDFYWINKVGNKIIYIIGDCTGHGVPGAFMSFIGVQQLNEIICEGRQTDPSRILFELNHRVNRLFKKERGAIHEGMDIGVCCFNFENKTLEYASARRPLYVARENDFWAIKGTSMSIGEDHIQEFETKKILLNPGDSIYLFTDGYADQIGGAHDKKFMSRRFKELLSRISSEPLAKQKYILETEFEEWKGSDIQIDDVCGFGLRIE